MLERDEYRSRTGLTNFDKKDLKFYEQAIKLYGDKKLYISDQSINAQYGNQFMSLHYTGTENLEKFWDIFRNLKFNTCKTLPPKKIYDVLHAAKVAGIVIPESVDNWLKEEIKEEKS